MIKRTIYPMIYRWAYATGREQQLIPQHEQNKIPKQTKSNWRRLSVSEIHLLEEELHVREQLDLLLEKEDLNWNDKRKLFFGIRRLHLKIIAFLGRRQYFRLLSHKKEEFVKLIEEASVRLPKKDLLRWFSISPHRYHLWYTQVNFECRSSQLKLCAKQHPYQITAKEYKIIEAHLLDPLYSRWPISSIHSELLKQGKITVSRSTFYKHARQISPPEARRKSRKPRFKPLRASCVNEYWHMDISYFTTRNNQRSFIYAIIDNYSRKIIAWRCEQEISRKFVGAVIREALQSVSLIKLNLVSDGGRENINHYIRHLIFQFYEQNGIEIDHQVALKTIQQSNSMIERFFRIMKSDFLYVNIPYSHAELCIAMEKIIHEYNVVRPHYALNHLTPDEAYSGKTFPDISERIKSARLNRLKKNKNCNCTMCICDEGKMQK